MLSMRRLLIFLCFYVYTNALDTIPLTKSHFKNVFSSTDAFQLGSDMEHIVLRGIQRETDRESGRREKKSGYFISGTNYVTCSRASSHRETKSELSKIVNFKHEHIKSFYGDAKKDLTCFLVHATTLAEQRKLLKSHSVLHPIPSKLSESLIKYRNDSVDYKRHSEVDGLIISFHPESKANEDTADEIKRSLRMLEGAFKAFSSKDCVTLKDHSMCLSSFMEYSSALRKTVLSAKGCNFHAVNISVSSKGKLKANTRGVPDHCIPSFLFFIASKGSVIFIEHKILNKVYSNAAASWVVQSGEQDVTPFYDLGVTGEGQVVGISDTGLDEKSCWFRDTYENQVTVSSEQGPYYLNSTLRKVVMYIEANNADDSDAFAGHGSHCAGSIAGFSENGGNQDAVGVAYNAKLAVLDATLLDSPSLLIPEDITSFLDPMHDLAGARIHSASWGSSSPSYTFMAEDFDAFIHEHPDHLVLIAAGNSGDEGQYSVGSPATFKNGLSVGAGCSPDSDITRQIYWSSKGPTLDGRIKPDVVAPGVDIRSARANRGSLSNTCDFQSFSGTSMATPILAGLAALIRDYLMQGLLPGYDAFTPSAAMLRAIIVNSGVSIQFSDLSSSFCGGDTLSSIDLDSSTLAPNVDQGWGRVEIDRVLPIGSDSDSLKTYVFDNVDLDQGQTISFAYEVEAKTHDLRVTLAWTDAPGMSMSSKALINDYDLEVIVNDNIYHGNGGNEADSIHNQERVYIPALLLELGETYTIRVTAKLLLQDAPGFALIVSGSILGDVQVEPTNFPTQIPTTPEPTRNPTTTRNPTFSPVTSSPSAKVPSSSPVTGAPVFQSDPGNTPEEAFEVNSYPFDYMEEISEDDTVDIYKVPAESGIIYKFEMQHSTPTLLDLDMALHRILPGQVFGQNTLINNSIAVSGYEEMEARGTGVELYVVIYSYSGYGSYSVSFNQIGVIPTLSPTTSNPTVYSDITTSPTLQVPGGTPDTARSVSLPYEVFEEFGGTLDSHGYKFTMIQGQHYMTQLSHLDDNVIDFDLEVYTVSSQTDPINFGELIGSSYLTLGIETILWTATETTDVYILAYSYRGSGQYKLLIQTSTTISSDPGILTSNVYDAPVPFLGFSQIQDANDKDGYRIPVVSGVQYDVNLWYNAMWNIDICLIQVIGDGNLDEGTELACSETSGGYEFITFTSNVETDFYLLVRPFSTGEGTGFYHIAFAALNHIIEPPTPEPTPLPSNSPSSSPTVLGDTRSPTSSPTGTTTSPSISPTERPTSYPTTASPSSFPTERPTTHPSSAPTAVPQLVDFDITYDSVDCSQGTALLQEFLNTISAATGLALAQMSGSFSCGSVKVSVVALFPSKNDAESFVEDFTITPEDILASNGNLISIYGNPDSTGATVRNDNSNSSNDGSNDDMTTVIIGVVVAVVIITLLFAILHYFCKRKTQDFPDFKQNHVISSQTPQPAKIRVAATLHPSNPQPSAPPMVHQQQYYAENPGDVAGDMYPI